MSRNSSFGSTWWGKKWIDALEEIDIDTNRLPRGRTYAKNGSVKDVQVQDSQVKAKVKGSRPSPYSVVIKLPLFSKTDRENINKLISKKPILQTKLSLGKLPEELLASLESSNISLFPKDWEEINASCSCPDWANPCKHLASVYYLLANEIDQNPFLLFNLRGISTEELTGRSKPEIKTDISPEIIKDEYISIENYEPVELAYSFDASLNFPVFDIKSLFSILPAKPPFFHGGDFRQILQRTYKDSIHAIEINELKEDIPSFLKHTNFHLTLSNPPGEKLHVFVSPLASAQSILPDRKLKPSKLKVPTYNEKIKKVEVNSIEGHYLSLAEITQFFLKIPIQANLQKISPSGRFLSVLTHFATACIRSNSFLPSFIKEKNEEFTIRYSPVLHNSGLQFAFQSLISIYPLDMGIHPPTKQFLKNSCVKKYMSFALDSIYKTALSSEKTFDTNKILSVFFREGNTFVPEQFQETNTHLSVENWLEHLGAMKEDIVPIIQIDMEDSDTFTIQAMVENKNDSLGSPIHYVKIANSQSETFFDQPRTVVLTKVARILTLAAEKLPPLGECLNSSGKKLPRIGLDTIAEILSDHSEFFELLGIKFILPKELKDFLKPEALIKAKSPKTIKYLDITKMLSFSWEIAIGDHRISPKEFAKLAEKSKGLVNYKGNYILLNPKEAQKILKKIKDPITPSSPLKVLYSGLAGDFNGTKFEADDNFMDFINKLFKEEKHTPPSDLNASMRPYQERGYQWIYSNIQKGLGVCIADDMGLGKTLQVIAVILKLKKEKKLKKSALVICPTSLLGNWKKEIEKFAPDLTTNIYHGVEKTLEIYNIDVVLTTYAHVRIGLPKFSKQKWTILILDEAQNIKNPLSEQAKAIKQIPSEYKIAMSGTPVENRLTELWSIYDFMNPGYLGDLKDFKEELAIPIERYRDNQALEKLRLVTSPFLIRRLKSDKSIINDLPDKIVLNDYCNLTKEQASIYETTVNKALNNIEGADGIQRKGLIFQLMTHLKQICNHPYHYSKRGDQSIDLSGKGVQTIAILEKILESDEKTLIFTQYKEMGTLLQKQIETNLKETALFYSGSLTRKAREKMINEFTDENGPKIIIISLKAGGTGLNLTNARNVIHYDLWWNPAVENQATDRVYRIGQKQNVQVHRLITLGTFEEQIDAMIQSKKELAELTVNAGETWITEMSNADLRGIFGLRKS
jgi:SNF2 family DNA or RNA helicase/uncharacterized Zn finger protein